MKSHFKQDYLIKWYIVKIFTMFRFLKFEIIITLMTISGKSTKTK